jgi:beta-lactam-binding protein with PASTA domain
MHPAITRLAVAGSVVLALSHPTHAALTPTNSLDAPQKPLSQSRPAERQTQEVIKAQPPSRQALQQKVQLCVVPDLTGTTANGAQTALASSNLRLGSTQSRPPNGPRGTVVDQRPQPKTRVPCGSAIDVWLAAPVPQSGTKDGVGSSPMVKDRAGMDSRMAGRAGQGGKTSDGPVTDCVVPDVTGHLVDEIRKPLALKNLQIGRITTRESDRPKGFVLAQTPSAGARVACGSQLVLVVAVPAPSPDDVQVDPPCVVSVPDVTGHLVEEIRKPLAKIKLEIGRITTREVDRPRGVVLAQSPSSGTRVACGSQVALLVAVPLPNPPSDPPPCVVPDLTGSEVGEIQRQLTRADLVLGTVGDRPVDVRPGTIVAQQPRSGTTVQCRSKVDVLVAVPPQPRCAPVPTLIGRDTKTAAVLLERGGLRLGTVDQRESNEDVGIILDQAPTAGSNVRCDTPVRVWVAIPPTGVPVPLLRGNDETGARGALERAGLVMGEITQRPSDQPTGSVVEQSPTAGTIVKRGSPVQVWLATTLPVTVPDLRGQDRATAADTLTRARLRLGETADRPSDRPAGTVVEQTPAPGTNVRPGSAVQVWLAGAPMATVPDLRGMDRASAYDTLTAARLQLGQMVDRPSDRTTGTIVEQTPTAGNVVRTGTAVHVWLAVPQPVKVPDVRGMDRTMAFDTLTSARLRLGEVADRQSDRAAGTIVEQTPTPGTVVRAGSAVQVWLAVATTLTVPDVRGRDRSAAAQVLTTSRLRLGEVADRPSDRPAGTIVEQTPAPGTAVPPGTAVQVWQAVPLTVTVPDVRGKDRAAAAQVLTTARLRLGEIADRPSERTQGTVLEQAPAPGSAVRPGSSVQVWLAVPPPATVPDLRGQDRARAADALTTARLRLGQIADRPSELAVGTVVDQIPPAGTNATAGTEVQIWLAVPITIEVPDVAGRTQLEAERFVRERGLALGAATQEASTNAAGTVLRQAPVAGARVTAGTAVDIVVASAPPPPPQLPPAVALIAVPDLFGRSESDARGILQAAGLQTGNISRVRSLVVRATITGQFPRPGAQVSPSAPIDLEIASLDLALLGMLGAGIALGLAAAAAVARVSGGGGQRSPAITLAPHLDSGVQVIPDGHALASSELSLQGFPDHGTQAIQSPAALVLNVAGGTR